MKEYLSIIDTGRCSTCTAFNCKQGTYGDPGEGPLAGRCGAWREETDGDTRPDGSSVYAYVKGDYSCERYTFHEDMGKHLAEKILFRDIVEKIGVANWRTAAGKSFDQMLRMMREIEAET
jgi:hypothetical protein